MATYRCRSCLAIFVDPQKDGTRFFHACGERVIDYEEGTRAPYEDPRDENVVQEEPGGKVHIKARGKGREKLSDEDLLTGLAPKDVKALQQRPAIGQSPLPEEESPRHMGMAMPAKPGQ